jgi:hypothetical protein
MVIFMHIATNVKVTELSLYEDAILDVQLQLLFPDERAKHAVVPLAKIRASYLLICRIV